MFNGNINNKHYTDPDSYYRDLNELAKANKSYTASCSWSTENSNEKTTSAVTNKSKDSVAKFIEDNLYDFDKMYEKYQDALDKDIFIEAIKDNTPWCMPEEQINRLKNFSEKELDMIGNILCKKAQTLDLEKKNNTARIANIDSCYENLNKKREQLYNELKELNSKINNMLKNREEYERNEVMHNFLDSAYENFDKVLCDVYPEHKDTCQPEKPEANSTEVAPPTIEDILLGFKNLYSKFLA